MIDVSPCLFHLPSFWLRLHPPFLTIKVQFDLIQIFETSNERHPRICHLIRSFYIPPPSNPTTYLLNNPRPFPFRKGSHSCILGAKLLGSLLVHG